MRSSGPRRAVGIAAAITATFLAGSAAAEPSTTTPDQGYDLGEMQGARGLAMGGAHYALGTSTSAIYGNPANLPFARVYHLEGLGSMSPEARRTTLGGAIADSSTSRLAGGLAVNWNMLDPDRVRRSWTDVRMALAFPLADMIAIGATGRYLRASQATQQGPFGASLVSDGTKGEPLFSELTFDAGVTVAPATGLRIGLVGKNLTNPATAFAPTLVGGGVGYASSAFSVELGGLADFTTWPQTAGRIMAGGEVFVIDHVPLRAGYRIDTGQKTQSVSLGTGYVDRKWSAEVAGRRDVVADHPMTMINLALRFFYDAGGGQGTEPEL
ncbi:MAG: hypothetical protein U0235_19995 [Polyangiaceae bacterium]